jgi:hypothetical protein
VVNFNDYAAFLPIGERFHYLMLPNV